jgi:hypothetical protein
VADEIAPAWRMRFISQKRQIIWHERAKITAKAVAQSNPLSCKRTSEAFENR